MLNSKYYETRLERKKKRRELPEDYINDVGSGHFGRIKSFMILNKYFIKMLFGLLSSHNYHVVLMSKYSLNKTYCG